MHEIHFFPLFHQFGHRHHRIKHHFEVKQTISRFSKIKTIEPNTMKKLILLPVALLLTAIFSLAQTPDKFSFKKSFDVSSPAKMDISTNDGFINAYGNSTHGIQVYFIVYKNGRVVDMDINELEEHVILNISNWGNHLEISIKDREKLLDWNNKYHVSIHILAPKQTACNLKTSDGDIELTGFAGNQICKTSDGDIAVENVNGEFSGKTSDGNITALNINGPTSLVTSDGDIKASKIHGEASFKTSDGKITANEIVGNVSAVTSDGNIVMENIDGTHNARTSDGNIDFEDLSGGLTAQTSDGDIHGNFEHLHKKLYLKTSDGNISVGVPAGLGMDVKLKGEDIHTRLRGFSGNTGDHSVEGTISGGGVEVELITSDGDIDLNYN